MSTRQEPGAGDGRGRLRVLVLTVVHDPEDARIRHRQIASLLRAGWRVTYAAPWAGYGRTPPTATPGLRCLDVARARGRRRWGAQRSARALLRREGPDHDVILLHDPELVPTVTGLRLPPVVWDVHEDPAAALEVKQWLPRALRGPAARGITAVERWAERRHALLLADAHYAARFRRPHPVVPNTTWVPAQPPRAAGAPAADGALRVVYLGSITAERGAAELVEIGRRLRADPGERAIRLEVIGPAHGPAQDLMRTARDAGDLVWTGPVPNDQALRSLPGALAGVSLLHDKPNFAPSMPTKVVEYLAHGVPVITTPLPVAADLVRRSGGGVVVPFGDVACVADEVVRVLRDWAARPEVPADLGARGYAAARRELDWAGHGSAFVDALTQVARSGRSAPAGGTDKHPADALAAMAVRSLSPRALAALEQRGTGPAADPRWAAALGRAVTLGAEQDAHRRGVELLDDLAGRVGHGALDRATATLWAQLLLRTGQEERLAGLVDDPALNLHPLQRWTLRTDLANPHRQDPSAAAWVDRLVTRAGGAAAADRAWAQLLDEPHRDAGLAALRLRAPEPGATAYRRLHAPVDHRVGGDLVSVVMSAYRPDQDLVLAVTSVLEQTWEALELLVVDDASPPGSEELLEAVAALDPRVQVVRAPRNGGTYAARNLAVHRARGRWMTFQDSDDWTHPQRVEVQARHLQEHPEVLANRTRALRAFPDLSLTYVGYPPRRLNASSLMVDLAALRELAGGFDAVRKSGDIELPLRLRAVREHSVVDLSDPWPLAITQLRAGSLSRADTVPGRTRWDRAAYREQFAEWHERVADGTSSPVLPRDPRPFPLPAPSWDPDRSEPPQPRRWDAVVLADLRASAPGAAGADGALRLAQALGEHELSTAVAHVETTSPLQQRAEPMAAEVCTAVRGGQVGLTGAQEDEEVDLLVVDDPAVALHLGRCGLRARDVVVLARSAPAQGPAPGAGPAWTVEEVDAAVRQRTGRSPRWLDAAGASVGQLAHQLREGREPGAGPTSG